MYTCFSQINAFKFTKQRILPLNPLMNIKRSDDIHSNLFCIQAVRRSFSPAILLTSASSKVNALVVSHVLRFTWGGGLFKSDARISAYLSKKSSSPLKPLPLMLNGDYAAETLGSGINAGAMRGQCPLAMVTSATSLLSGAVCVPGTIRREQHLVWTCSDTGSQSLSLIRPVEIFKNVVSRFYSFYISNLGKKKKICAGP